MNESYWDTDEYAASLKSQPDVVTIMLGTNDAYYSFQEVNPWNSDWNAFAAEFEDAYASMIRSFQSLPSRPEVLLAIPPPDFTKVGILNVTLVNGGFSTWIPQI